MDWGKWDRSRKPASWSPGPHLSFHRVYAPAGEAPLDDEVYTDLSEYMVAMRVNPQHQGRDDERSERAMYEEAFGLA